MPPVLTELLVAALCSSGMAAEAMDMSLIHVADRGRWQPHTKTLSALLQVTGRARAI
jgi:hypothetical protein